MPYKQNERLPPALRHPFLVFTASALAVAVRKRRLPRGEKKSDRGIYLRLPEAGITVDTQVAISAE
jgi:hypothetical protein